MLLYRIEGEINSFKNLDHTDVRFINQITINKTIQIIYKITLNKYNIII